MFRYDYRFYRWQNAILASEHWSHRGSEARCRVFSDPTNDRPWVLRVTNPKPVGDGWVAV